MTDKMRWEKPELRRLELQKLGHSEPLEITLLLYDNGCGIEETSGDVLVKILDYRIKYGPKTGPDSFPPMLLHEGDKLELRALGEQ